MKKVCRLLTINRFTKIQSGLLNPSADTLGSHFSNFSIFCKNAKTRDFFLKLKEMML